MSTGEPSEPTIPPPQQEPTNPTRGKGKRTAQPLLNIPRKKQASVPDEATPTPAAAIADLIGTDRPLSDADLHDIHDLIGRHLNSRENVLIGDGSDEQQDGDPGPAIPSLISPPTSTRRVPGASRFQELFPRAPLGQPQATSSLRATSGVRVQGPSAPSASLPLGSLMRSRTIQGSQPNNNTLRLDILLNHSSFLQYQRLHQTEAKLLASLTQARDQLCATLTKIAAVLEDTGDFVGGMPQWGAVTDLAAELGDAIKLVDEAVNVASQKMLFETRQISEEVAVLSGDLDLHNQLNPGNPIDIKRLKALQDMSKRVERQARPNESPEGYGQSGARERPRFRPLQAARWSAFPTNIPGPCPTVMGDSGLMATGWAHGGAAQGAGR